MKIAVLGAGMVGRTIALDLSKKFNVTSFDINVENLNKLSIQSNGKVLTSSFDLQNYSYQKILNSFDFVVSAVPGFMGYKTLEAIINAGKNVVDISFFKEDAKQLDKLAKEKQVIAITDCGVAPGMSNLILGRYSKEINIETFKCYVGGLPLYPKVPFNYKAPFSPIDVIEEYLRPARLIENGKIVIKPALTELEMIYFNTIDNGCHLEAFNTDGLRSLLNYLPGIKEMKEKTLRYAGHANAITILKQGGFFEEDAIKDTTKVLLKSWKLEENEPEFTVMRVIIEGYDKEGYFEEVIYNLYDEFDKNTNLSSMSRTTGYTCTAVVNLIINGLFKETGVFMPETLGENKQCFDFVLEYLKERNVSWQKL